MKRIVTLVVLLLFVQNSFGQKIRITDLTNRWTAYNYDFEPLMEYFHTVGYNGYTIVNNLKYSRMDNLLVREDTVTNKVYCRWLVAQIDTSEALLYDYNLTVGDTFTRHEDTITWKHWVVSLDSVLINNTWHKIWKFAGTTNSPGTAGDYTVIEGIGAINSYTSSLIAGPLHPLHFEAATFITCFSNRYGQPAINTNITFPLPFPQSGGYVFNNTASCTLAVGDQQAQGNSISIRPNPVNSSSEIKFSHPVHKGDIIIYNSIGQLVYKADIDNQSSIPIGKFISRPGAYFYRIVDRDKNQVYAGKFVAQ